MSWFPQIGSGSMSQYPLRRVRQWRNIENQLEGGESIVSPDAASSLIRWEMSWKELSDSEADSLRELYTAVDGSYGAFSFVDPLVNLLAWSEDLTKPDWVAGQLICLGGGADPLGSANAWTVLNPTAGEQSLTQSVNLPANYVSCFSVWLRADVPQTAHLERSGSRVACRVESTWKRFYIGATGLGSSADFSLALDAGAALQAFGFQVEAQPYPSQYKRSRTARGIYEETRFAGDELTLVATGHGLTACDITLVSRI